MNIQHRRVNVGRLTLHVAVQGEGEPVLLLHGFPSHWEDWQGQMAALAARGFCAIAPDLPGYGDSEQLPRVLDYRASLLAGDLAGLIGALGLRKAHVVGHDWGGVLAFCLASQYPALVDKLVVLNGPHPELLWASWRHVAQLRRSWYIFMFQLPWFPEWLAQRRAAMSVALQGMAVRPGTFGEQDLQRHLREMRRPGVAHAAMNYYRALLRAPARAKQPLPHSALVLWGNRDLALSGRLLLTDLARYVPQVRVERFADAGHWPHLEHPERVNQHLIEFFRG